MVQNDTRRRSSLILGVLLALLLGVAAGFLVLAVPVRMLESVTTFTRLSSLMVQAEPPISPSDRTLLAVLAGIMTAGIGWVLVDWLLFARAGLNTIIKPREDEYEEEEGDHFRPTDPLDLVSSAPLPTQDWAPPPSGDARRPLSARTDIGDPPPIAPGAVAVPPLATAPSPNPFGQILPGVGTPAPPLQSMVPPPLQQLAPSASPSAQPLSGAVWGNPDPAVPEAHAAPSRPTLDLSTPAPPPAPTAAPAPAFPPAAGWLPVPGARPDGSQPRVESDEASRDYSGDTAERPVDQSAFAPPPAMPPSFGDHGAATSEIPLVAPSRPDPLGMQSAGRTAPVFDAPEAQPPGAPPAYAPDAPLSTAAPPPSTAASPRRSSLPEPGFDKARLEELLTRLERGLQNRRAAAAAAATASSVVANPAAPHPQAGAAVQPVPRAEPPMAYAAHKPDPLLPVQPQPASPPPLFSIPPVTSQAAPVPVQASAVAPPSVSQMTDATARNDEMLDQPLHVTLDLLRSMVKR